MDDLIESYGRLGNRLVFIADGGTWIKNWVEDSFPDAVSVLDYYHACEHLCNFENIRTLGGKSDAADKLINYYLVNASRMNYKLYKSIGAGIIGSGAIESAHRTVVQKRMKQSGQRWTKKGAQNMLNLRVLQMNGQWGKVEQLIRNAA